MEPIALAHLSKVYGIVIQRCGLFLHSSGVLGASPDGVVGCPREAVVEIKCPFTMKNALCKDDFLKDKKFGLKKLPNGRFILESSSQYWNQVQMQMYLTGTNKCFFILYAENSSVTTIVPVDPQWQQNIQKLIDFYWLRCFNDIFNNLITNEAK